jgi:hypothetical protein
MSANQPGTPPEVTITESALSTGTNLQVPACSVTLVRFELR